MKHGPLLRAVTTPGRVASPVAPRTVHTMGAPDLDVERSCWAAGESLVCGLDEVGRGSWAGPVMIGAVVVPRGDVPSGSRIAEVRDSKLLSAAKREALYPVVREWAVSSAVGSASPAEIDELGMTGALRLAAQRALAGLEVTPERILLDGPHNYVGHPCPVTTIVKGDMTSLSIAAASIVAKVERDRVMRSLAEEYPEYHFEQNAGYGSAAHKAALKEHGALPVHRRSWSFMRDVNVTQLTFDDVL